MFGSRNKRIKILVKRNQPGFIVLPHSYIRKHQRGIDGIVQQCHATESLLHHTPFIDHAVYLLTALVLIDIDHQLMTACTGLPVYGAIIVSLYILFDLFKLSLMSSPTNTLDTEFGQVIR